MLRPFLRSTSPIALAFALTYGCAPSPPTRSASPPQSSAEDTQRTPPQPAAARSTLTERPLVAGKAVGGLLGAYTPPPLEQGLRGALQAIPELRVKSPEQLASEWMAIKRQGDLRAQHKSLYQKLRRPSAARGLVDIRSLEGRGLPPFGSRDRTRGRTWVQATTAAVLIKAHELFTSRFPDATLTLGDLAQPGGGNLFHNVIVRDVEGERANSLLDSAKLVGGEWSIDTYGRAADFPGELGRFNSPEDEVWTRQVLAGHGFGPEGQLRLRVHTTRYTFPSRPIDEDRAKAFGDLKRLMKRSTLVHTAKVKGHRADGATETLWLQHWIAPKEKRQLITLSTKQQRRRLKTKWLRSARHAQWQQRKPGSYSREVHWTTEEQADGTRGWVRWQAMREAGHVTHMAGSDADISFVTTKNTRHFAVDLSVFDAKRTWAWFEALDQAASLLATRIDAILVSPVIIRALERRLTKRQLRSTLWRRHVRRAGGHDAHHHLRLAPPTNRSEALATTLLAELDASGASQREATSK